MVSVGRGRFLADLGEAGGETLLWERDDLPDDTAESLSESSDLTLVLLLLLDEEVGLVLFSVVEVLPWPLLFP